MRLLFSLVIFISFNFSCGKSGGDSNEIVKEGAKGAEKSTNSYSLFIATENDQPACDVDHEGQLIYVEDVAKFKHCKSGVWVEIDIKGEKGDTGAAGTDGAKGDKGDKGDTGIKIASQYVCGASIDLDSGADTRKGLAAKITKFTDGSFFMTCLSEEVYASTSHISLHEASFLYTSDSIAVEIDKILMCVPYYVTAYYNIDLNQVAYVNQADTSSTAVVSCTQAYP